MQYPIVEQKLCGTKAIVVAQECNCKQENHGMLSVAVFIRSIRFLCCNNQFSTIFFPSLCFEYLLLSLVEL